MPRRVNDDHILDVCSVRKTFGGDDVVALDDVSLSVEPGEFVVLLGPSGCGKTTLLRSVAGLEAPSNGSITIDGREVFCAEERLDVDPAGRYVGMMFQTYALWPHMTVGENIAFPLRVAGVRRAERNKRIDEILAAVRIADLGDRYPGQLSGGQQQRVALARALVSSERLILFDEPLSNVDAKVRDQLRNELLRLRSELEFAAVYVTHDQVEALELADRVIVMDRGRIAQSGTPEQIYFEPANLYVANFVGSTNEAAVTGPVTDMGNGMWKAPTTWGELTGRAGGASTDDRTPSHVVWRPEQVSVTAAETSTTNRWAATVERVIFRGSETEVHARTEYGTQTVVYSTGLMTLKEGDDVWIGVEPANALFLT